MDYRLLFLPGILFLGFITSYQDIRYGKIRNKWIIVGLIYTLIIYLFVIFVLKLPVEQEFIIQSLANMIIATLFGFLLWHLGLWTAGDGKLFTAFALMIPLSIYNAEGFIPYFPSLNLIINAFFPITVFFFVNMLIVTTWGQKKESIKKAFNLRIILESVVGLFAILWLWSILINSLQIQVHWFYSLFFIFFLFSMISYIMSKYLLLVAGAVSFLRLILDRSVYSLEFVLIFSTMMFIFIVFRYFISELSFHAYTKKVRIDDLKPGMIPAEAFYSEDKEYKIRRFDLFNLFSYINGKDDVIDFKSEGLDEEGLKKIKTLAKNHKGLEYFQIQDTLPFAPFMFLGAIITWISAGNIFIALKDIMINIVNFL